MLRENIELGSRLIPFHEGWQRQRDVHGKIVEGRRPSTLLLVEHEPVYTIGRRVHPWERPSADIVEPGHVPVVNVDRGGKTAWHGPGQLTVYSILRLAQSIDIIRYVRALEIAVIDLCGLYGLETIRVEERSGVWLPADPEVTGEAGQLTRPERKICALGVRVARGVTMHGIGLSTDSDLEAFFLDRIIPCGIDDVGVTSLAAETDRHLATGTPTDALVSTLESHLLPLMTDAT